MAILKAIRLFLLANISLIVPTLEVAATSSSQSNRAQALESRKNKLSNSLEAQKNSLNINKATKGRIDTRSKARETQQKAQTVINVTSGINETIQKMPLAIRQQHATSAVAVLNQVVLGVSVGVRALARRKEALQAIEHTDEQILEAAIKSYEKIQSLTTTLESLLGPKTIGMAYKENKSSTMSKGQKLLNLLNTTHYLNTFNKFTDNLRIADNKAARWEKIQETTKVLKEEQDRLDDYIALMQIKALERMIMNLHSVQNKDVTIPRLKEFLITTNKGIEEIDKQIKALSKQKATKKGIVHHLKKRIGKDEDTKRGKELENMKGERQKYLERKLELETQIKQLQTTSKNISNIQKERDDLKKQIEEINLFRVVKTTPKEIAEELISLKREIQELRTDFETLKRTTLRSTGSK